MINMSFMEKNEGDNFHGVPSAHNFMLNDYSANAFKFQRNDQNQFGLQNLQQQQNMGLASNEFENMQQSISVPSGEFDSRNFVPLSNFKPSKRHSFAGHFGHQSMRCIIDETRQAAANSEWFNASGPNVSAMEPTTQSPPEMAQRDDHDEESIVTFTTTSNAFGERHHSEPQLNALILPDMSHGIASRGRTHTMPSLTHASKHVNSTFETYECPKTPVPPELADHDNIELSPIGDGTTCGLFDLLKDFTGDSAGKDSEDLFAPLPF
jgi:hypothetical protein